MRILIECGLDIVDVFHDCDVERSLARYADQVADAARELYPDADVTYRIDTRTGFGVRIDGIDDTEALRERADEIWTDQTWLVDPRAEALALHGVGEVTHLIGRTYQVGRAEWLVLTEEEADARAGQLVRESLWTLRTEWLADHCSVTLSRRAIAALAKMQADLCEDAQPLIEALVEDPDDVVEAALREDGRGHFLAGYDGREVVLAGGYYGYRVG